MYRLFSLTLFVSAALVLWIQPMFCKMILPYLGGTPAVWNTCLVFFQGTLLLGYLYAHLQSKFVLRHQLISHGVLLVLCLVLLPISIPLGWTPPTETNPTPWLFLLLSVSLGLPFLLLCATAPLLQRWFLSSGDKYSGDPYFLYVASNWGSLIGLFGYPAIVEPNLTLAAQSLGWSGGYIFLTVSIVVLSALLWRKGGHVPGGTAVVSPAPGTWQGMKWLILAAIPSSLLQSVTTYMTTDIAAVPLLWIVPLGVYFLTFILVFHRTELLSHRLMVLLLPVVLVGLSFSDFWLHETELLKMSLLCLLTLFVTAMVFHGELVRTRPAAEHLTKFYLWMATGGVVGGIFSALVAPVLFTGLLEYPIVLVVAAMCMPSSAGDGNRPSVRDFCIPVAVLAAGGSLLLANHMWSFFLTQRATAVVGTALAIVIYLSRKRPIRFGAGLAAFLLVGFLVTHIESNTVLRDRGFFGTLRIDLAKQDGVVTLFHGHTSHGKQALDPKRRNEPTSYYYRGGPLGQVFASLPPAPNGRTVGVIGLGAGTMATYAGPLDHWTFYEINPQIAAVAQDAKYFTYLRDCKAKVEVVHGDGRLLLSKAPDNSFDVIFLDAFSSDSVPVHLLTTEALNLYLRKLRPNGIVAFHISNQYLKLDSVLANLAKSCGAPGCGMTQILTAEQERHSLGSSSAWGVVARREQDMKRLVEQAGWRRFHADPGKRPWADDYSSLFSYLKPPS
ncbi:MAG TPA: fused MFS/spermidine synthase [Desulfomonilaceae bacterium]|nr:fused MFS/spermidine synthase [Desulfomonilaceae bacterium]